MELQHALTQIADIRKQMTLAGHFRGFRAASTLGTAMAAAAAGIWQWQRAAELANYPLVFVALWVSVAIASIIVCGGEMIWRYRNSESPSQRELAVKAAEQFLPFVIVGGLVTFVIVLNNTEAIWMLSGLWQVLFGLGIFSLRKLAPWPVVFVGAFYVFCGLLNLSDDLPYFSPWSMAAPFSVGQTACAAIFYWCLERNHAA